jgi:UDPglucose 6-dehydrogenase
MENSCDSCVLTDIPCKQLYTDIKGRPTHQIYIVVAMESVGLIGVGRLGICMALSMERAGYNVVCMDTNERILDAINRKDMESHEPSVTELLRASRNLSTTTSYADMFSVCDIVFVVVPTPSLMDNTYDHKYIEQVVTEVCGLGVQSTKKVLVISCTTMPEYCAFLRERLASYNIDICYNPEFIAQGDIMYGFEHPDIVLIGSHDDVATQKVCSIYQRVCKNNPSYCVMSLTEAEITKVSLNCFITMKIAYANMIGDLVKKSGGRNYVVLDAISKDSRIGEKCMKWGYGYGGPCFPRDNLALQEYAKEKGVKMILSKATDAANMYHMEQMLSSIKDKHTKDEVIWFSPYITYKQESVILERSFPLMMAEKLVEDGYKVHIHERECVIKELQHRYGDSFTYSTI